MILSIIIPVYNEADYIGEVIESIFQLKFPDIREAGWDLKITGR